MHWATAPWRTPIPLETRVQELVHQRRADANIAALCGSVQGLAEGQLRLEAESRRISSRLGCGAGAGAVGVERGWAVLILIAVVMEKWFLERGSSPEVGRARRVRYSVVSALCDAVVHLDSERRIDWPASPFSHLLLHGGGGPAATRTSWTETPCTTGPRRRLASGPGCSSPAPRRSRGGRRRPSTFFHAYFPDVNDQPGHPIGIR